MNSRVALGEMPFDLALDSLIRGWDWMQKRRPKVGDDIKKLHDRLGLEILKVVQQLSGQSYPTMTEMEIWWSRHSREGKETTAARERDREKARREAPAPLNELPPVLIVELLFNERGGFSTSNQGSSSGAFPTAALTKGHPAWSPEIPPSGGSSSLDWGQEPGPYAVDVAGSMDHLKNPKSFTVAGWINARNSAEGAGGNRIVSWLDREGVEIVHRSDGSLQVGINQKTEGSEARTPSLQMRLRIPRSRCPSPTIGGSSR